MQKKLEKKLCQADEKRLLLYLQFAGILIGVPENEQINPVFAGFVFINQQYPFMH
jgi:hypothetical protein